MNRLFRRQFILFLGLSFGLVFWILSAAYDHFVMGRTGFFESLVAGSDARDTDGNR